MQTDESRCQYSVFHTVAFFRALAANGHAALEAASAPRDCVLHGGTRIVVSELWQQDIVRQWLFSSRARPAIVHAFHCATAAM